MDTAHTTTPNTPTPNPLLEQTIALRFAGDTLTIGEMTLDQTLRLADMQDALAGLDLSNLAVITKQHQPTVLQALSIMLGIDVARLRKGKQSEVVAAVQACVALNQSFFLQILNWWVQAVSLKNQVQSKLNQAQSQAAALSSIDYGQLASALLSQQATASAMFTNTATANSLPTSPPPMSASAASLSP